MRALVALATALLVATCFGQQSGQIAIDRIESMPRIPAPFLMRDWRATALNFDRLVFDPTLQGEFLPLVWTDKTHVNSNQDGFGLPSYVGHPQMNGGYQHEAVTCIGAVLSGMMVGAAKRTPGADYAAMCKNYFVSSTGENVVLNRTNTASGGSFWYDIFPQILFNAVANLCGNDAAMDRIVRTSANRWAEACREMLTPEGHADFNHTGYSFIEKKAKDNGKWREPEGAGGAAYLMATAYAKFKDPKFLEAATWCLQNFQRRDSHDNPTYEVLVPYGALAAARLNAEQGKNYDIAKFVNWCFNPDSPARPGIGVVLGKWGGYDVNGLFGGTTVDYVFGFNTFAMAGALVPLVRYDTRFARAIGKWMLHAANNARLFYPDGLPKENQTCAWWKGDPYACIPYEGLRREWQGKNPLAMGDPLVAGWAKTDLSLYSGSFAGFFGAVVAQTNEAHILSLDCLATDFYRPRAYPTYLLYNPETDERTVRIKVGQAAVDVYDAVTDTIVMAKAQDTCAIRLRPDHAAVIVLTPAGGKLAREGSRTMIDGVTVRYR